MLPHSNAKGPEQPWNGVGGGWEGGRRRAVPQGLGLHLLLRSDRNEGQGALSRQKIRGMIQSSVSDDDVWGASKASESTFEEKSELNLTTYRQHLSYVRRRYHSERECCVKRDVEGRSLRNFTPERLTENEDLTRGWEEVARGTHKTRCHHREASWGEGGGNHVESC